MQIYTFMLTLFVVEWFVIHNLKTMHEDVEMLIRYV